MDRKLLIKHLGLYGIFLGVILMFIFMWLRLYTNHNQKIKIENFKDKNIKEVLELANKHNFKVEIIDSTFIIGQKGGLVLSQNPKAGSMVKENRTIYLTITKYGADKMKLSELPVLYGNDYEQKSKELELRGIFSRIMSKKFDAGEPNHILEVYYNGRLIDNGQLQMGELEISKGDFLDFVVSSKEEGDIIVPDVTCKTVEEAGFLLQEYSLSLGEITAKGSISDTNTAYIILQEPQADGIMKIPVNSGINLTIVQNKPAKCN